jgi:hypothetical protein
MEQFGHEIDEHTFSAIHEWFKTKPQDPEYLPS